MLDPRAGIDGDVDRTDLDSSSAMSQAATLSNMSPLSGDKRAVNRPGFVFSEACFCKASQFFGISILYFAGNRKRRGHRFPSGDARRTPWFCIRFHFCGRGVEIREPVRHRKCNGDGLLRRNSDCAIPRRRPSCRKTVLGQLSHGARPCPGPEAQFGARVVREGVPEFEAQLVAGLLHRQFRGLCRDGAVGPCFGAVIHQIAVPSNKAATTAKPAPNPAARRRMILQFGRAEGAGTASWLALSPYRSNVQL